MSDRPDIWGGITFTEPAEARRVREAGGPAEIGQLPLEFLRYRPFGASLELALPELVRWSKDGEAWAIRHWPWAALAADSWLADHARQSDGLRPTDVDVGFDRITKHARALSDVIAELQQSSSNPAGNAATQTAHLRWLLTVFSRMGLDRVPLEQAAGSTDAEGLMAFAEMSHFTEKLEFVAAAAGLAKQLAQRELLARPVSGSDPMLPKFVWRLSEVWTSLTGRKASAAKVHKVDETRPDFVIFVQAMAALALEAHQGNANPQIPTHDMIAAALRA